MGKGRGREVLIYPSAHPQRLARVWTAVYLLNVGPGPPQHGVEGTRGCTSLQRVEGQRAAPRIYVHETNIKDGKKCMNMIIRSVVDRPW